MRMRPRALAWAASVSSCVLAATVAYVTLSAGRPALDVRAESWLAANVPAAWRAWLAGPASSPADSMVVALAVAAGSILLLAWRRARDALWLAGTWLAGLVLVTLLKEMPHRDRPFPLLDSGSFPSGHATAATLDGGMLVALVAAAWLERRGAAGSLRPWLAGWIGLAAFIGLARIAGGVHWVTDVVGGWSLGALLLCASLALRQALPVVPPPPPAQGAR